MSLQRTEAMRLQKPDRTPPSPSLVIEVAEQRYNHTTLFKYLGGIIHEEADFLVEIERRIHMRASL